MISYECERGNLRKLGIGGHVSDILADILVLVSATYGVIKKQDEGSANEFQLGLLSMFIDDDIRKKVFSSDIVDVLGGEGGNSDYEVYHDGEKEVKVDKNILGLMSFLKNQMDAGGGEEE